MRMRDSGKVLIGLKNWFSLTRAGPREQKRPLGRMQIQGTGVSAGGILGADRGVGKGSWTNMD